MQEEFKVSVMTDPNDSTTRRQINTLNELHNYGSTVKEELFSDPEQNRKFLLWFFEKVPPRIGNWGRSFTEELFKAEFSNAEKFLKSNKVFANFENLELDDSTWYLDTAEPMEYYEGARVLADSLPDECKEAAVARIAVNAMVLAVLPGEFPEQLRRAMLMPWKQNRLGTPKGIPVTRRTEVSFKWKELGSKLPELRIIKNETIYPVQIILNSDFGNRNIWIPANSSLTSVFVGQHMTCINGAVCVNGDFAACQQGAKIMKYSISINKYLPQELPDPDAVYGMALHLSGRLQLLTDDVVRIWDNEMEHTISACMGIYAMESAWLLHKKDGSTYSNIGRMNQKDVIAVIQTEEDIVLLTRSGEMHSLKKRIYTHEQLMESMYRRFADLGEGDAERLVHRGREIVRTQKGELVCRSL